MSVEDREQLAREGGWIPEDEWDSNKPTPKGGFKTADDFLNDAASMLISSRKQQAKLESKLDKMGKRLEQTVADSRAVNALVQQGYEREKREADRLRQQLEGDKQAAIDIGDSEAAIRADRELSKLEAVQPAVPAVDPTVEKQVAAWVQRNQWYRDDPELREAAEQISTEIGAAYPPGLPRLSAVEAEVRRRFPDRVSSAPQIGGTPGNPASNTRPTGRTNGRTFNDLPEEAQSAYTRFKNLNPSMTKTQYLAEYDWET